METKTLKLTFAGGTGVVTGANFLLESESHKYLIDCGLEQKSKLADETNWEPFIYDPKSIEILFITHAHIDHIGRIPKLYADGFRGKIYSTEVTRELARPMLMDTVGILGRVPEHNLGDIYTAERVEQVLGLWEGFDYNQKVTLADMEVVFHDAGHILGSAMVEFLYNGKRILFTGDLGNSPSPILRDTALPKDIDYLIMETVYGDRNHDPHNVRKQQLATAIQDNFKRKGTLIIPTFSLERAQELLFEIDDLVENERVPKMPIFLDSPLAINLTDIFRRHQNLFNDKARQVIASGNDVFNFPGLRVTLATEDSKHIVETPDPKIIMAGSGMSNGGRIIHHERNYLPNANNTILLVGYQSLGTLGREIQEGAKTIRIYGERVPVRAHVAMINGYSGHKDSDHLIQFVEDLSGTLKRVFCVMGEPKSSMFIAQKVRDYLGLEATVPERGSTTELVC
jgi:metallo-beta-lactamase family protein